MDEEDTAMKQYEYIDEFIAETLSALGDTYTHAEIEDWANQKGYDIDVGACLTTHRQSPNQRTFTGERVGMGPKAYYRLVERPQSASSPAVLRMHQQQGAEMVRRWMNEYRFRMGPIAGRSKKALAALTVAETQIKLVAAAMHADLDLDGDEDAE